MINIVQHSGTCTSRLIKNFTNEDVTPLSEAMVNVIDRIRQSDTSRRLTYKYNQEAEVYKVYKERHVINELHRLFFTQFGVSGHSLACETGRWNRRGRGRLPLQERLHRCADIQTKQHVIQQCPMTQRTDSYQFTTTMNELFSIQFSPEILCKIIHEALNTYKSRDCQD